MSGARTSRATPSIPVLRIPRVRETRFLKHERGSAEIVQLATSDSAFSPALGTISSFLTAELECQECSFILYGIQEPLCKNGES
jgi:hypothetical protein